MCVSSLTWVDLRPVLMRLVGSCSFINELECEKIQQKHTRTQNSRCHQCQSVNIMKVNLMTTTLWVKMPVWQIFWLIRNVMQAFCNATVERSCRDSRCLIFTYLVLYQGMNQKLSRVLTYHVQRQFFKTKTILQ